MEQYDMLLALLLMSLVFGLARSGYRNWLCTQRWLS
jgi:hypothetical protein